MFNIFKSNKMENLIDAMASVLKEVPDNPMMPEWIGIQSRGMKQWISMQMAHTFGVCTNMHFFFPRQMVDKILTGFNPPEEQNESLNEDLLFWSVMKLIRENRSKELLPDIEHYIREDATGKKLYQLSMKIANVFDDYQVYRPGMLIDWQTKKKHETLKDPVARWQADLWSQLVSKDPPNHLAFRIHLFLEKVSLRKINRDYLPLQMTLFGI